MVTSVRLSSMRQALVMTQRGWRRWIECSVLIEGSLGQPPTLCIARSLCTVEDNKVNVEVCIASAEECWVMKGTVVSSTSVIPESAFGFEKMDTSCDTTVKETTVKFADAHEVVSSVTETQGEVLCNEWKAEKPEVPPEKGETLTDIFSNSDLSTEQRSLFLSELDTFWDMFVESSKKPGRTKMLRIGIDTGDSLTVKQYPYRFSA
ncbi:hypothetical protein PI125_g12365 [Phytophthora idaei]|nr:hypothetical protein PI125_g12365 [Phytophthora idaei]KAG3152319.1 hypothetical protein PI126_g10563 [Phytophthora idaei]